MSTRRVKGRAPFGPPVDERDVPLIDDGTHPPADYITDRVPLAKHGPDPTMFVDEERVLSTPGLGRELSRADLPANGQEIASLMDAHRPVNDAEVASLMDALGLKPSEDVMVARRTGNQWKIVDGER